MRPSVLESWDGRRSRNARRFRPRAATPFRTAISITAFDEVPEGFQRLDDFLRVQMAELMPEELAATRRDLVSERFQQGEPIDLASLRLQKGLSQSELADKIGCSQPRLSLWEAGKERPSFEYLRKLRESLDVDFNTLMLALDNV